MHWVLRRFHKQIVNTVMESGMSVSRDSAGAWRARADVNKGVDGVARPSKTESGTMCFVSETNVVTGQTQWVQQPADYDYHQEIARSSYGDMLHDTERNQKYYSAICQAVELLKKRGQRVDVLDIGAGTGLLSMMAASQGVDSVTACEAFEPMAGCASQVLKENGFDESVRLIRARSTEITAGPGGAMSRKANLLVTEVFDTELIGEGAIDTFVHAHKNLLQEDCLVVPRAANMYVQPVCSPFVRRWNDAQPVSVAEGKRIRVPRQLSSCGGAPSLHDLQLDQLDQGTFTPLTQPLKVFRFDFGAGGSLKERDCSSLEAVSEAEGTVDAFFVWWDLEMDPLGKIILSCAPRWAHPDAPNLPWRDHWMQAIFYPPERLAVKKGETMCVTSQHDKYSLWFQATPTDQQLVSAERPICECGLHIAVSRSRLAMLGDDSRNNKFIQALRQHVMPDTVCLTISDGSLLSLIAALLGAKKVFALEGNSLCADVVHKFIEENQLSDTVTLIRKTAMEVTAEDLQGYEVDLVVGEPHFQSALLPWEHMHLWYGLSTLRPLLGPRLTVLPSAVTVYAMAMDFKDLWKIRAPVGTCEGFNLHTFDALIKRSSDVVDCPVEPHPLWEYPGVALSAPLPVLTQDLTQDPTLLPSSRSSHQLQCGKAECVNGVALWCDFHLAEGLVVSGGPRESPVLGQRVCWDFDSRQAVYLCPPPRHAPTSDTLTFDLNFNPAQGGLDFTWHF